MLVYITYVNMVAKARLFTAVFSQLTAFTADCLCHHIQMAGIETIWKLHTLIFMNSWFLLWILKSPPAVTTLAVSELPGYPGR